MRALHFSDVHVQLSLAGLSASELLSKRLLGGANLLAGRASLFRDSSDKISKLHQFSLEHEVCVGLCSGDFTALGTGPEHARVAELLAPFSRLPGGFFAVPGNHDLYLHDSLRGRHFERYLGPLLAAPSTRPAPWSVELDASTVLIGLHSARPNPNPFLSSGELGEAQLEELRALLARHTGRLILVMTHYAPLRPDGRPDTARHGLRDADRLLALCARQGVVLIHGHIHWRYFHPYRAGAQPWMFCAGSVTHRGREGLWLYELEAGSLRAIPGSYREGRYVLDEASAVAVRW